MGSPVRDESTNSNVSTQVDEQIQEEENNGSCGKMLFYISSAAGSFWALWRLYEYFFKEKETFDPMNNIVSVESADQSVIDVINYRPTNSTFRDAIDYQKSFCHFILLLKDITSKCPETFDMEESFKTYINEVKQQMADKVIRDSAKISFLLIAIQCAKLYFASKEISKANHLHQDAVKFQETNKTKLVISNLRLRINKSIQRLDVYADTQLSDGICNSVMTIGNIVQLYDAAPLASGLSTFIGSAVIFGLLFITIRNGLTYYETKTRFKELQKDLQQLENNSH